MTNRPLRVLYSFPFPLGDPGIGTTAMHEVRGLVERGVLVDVVTTSSRVPLTGVHRLVQTLSVAGQRVPHRAFGSVQRAYDLHDRITARRLRAHHGDYDLVHVWPRGCLRTAAAAAEVGVPSVREVVSPHTRSAFERARDAAAEFGLTLPPRHSHAWDDAVLCREEAEYDAVDALLVPSSYVRSTFVERGFDPQRLLAVQYGYDPQRFAPAPREPGHGLRAVFLGRGEPNKGLHLALRAWRDSGAGERGGTFDVAGRLWQPYAELIADDLAGPGVRVHGFADAAQLLAGADVLLLPSMTEGSALVVYEAIGSGAVPLVSDASGAPITDGVEGLVHRAGDLAELTRGLRALDEDRELLARMRAAALAAAPGLTWSAAASRLVAAYETVLARGGNSRSALPR